MIWPGTSRTQRKVWKLQFLMAEDKRNNKLGLVFGGDALIAAVPIIPEKYNCLNLFVQSEPKMLKAFLHYRRVNATQKNEVFH